MNQMERLSSRTVDELGRIVLPNQLRKEMGWGTGADVSVYYVNKTTVILQISGEQMKAAALEAQVKTEEIG